AHHLQHLRRQGAAVRAVLAGALVNVERFTRDTAAVLGDTDDVEAELRGIAREIARTVLTDRIVALRRLLTGESQRFPDLAREYHERVPGRVVAMLADVMRRFDDNGVPDVAGPSTSPTWCSVRRWTAPCSAASSRPPTPSRP